MRDGCRALAIAVATLAFVPAPPPAVAQSPFNQFKSTIAPPKPSANQPAQAQKPGAPAPSAVDSPTGPLAAPADTRIEVLAAGPLQQAYQAQASPLGAHVAIRGMSGSRHVAIYDGTIGPKFDELSGSFIFSPDGNHWAYCGRVGPTWHYMVDGKDMLQTPARGCFIGFTSNSKHVWFLVTQDPPTRFYFDGQAGPPGGPNVANGYIFSPDGNHYAYVGVDAAAAHLPSNTQLVVDGHQAPYDGSEPQWSADSQHLFTRRQSPSRTAWDVLLDGRPIMRADSVTLFIPPAGDRFIARVVRNTRPSATQFLVIGGKEVAGSETTGQIGPISFSPDGKRYAAKYSMGSGRNWILADGQKGQEYQGLFLHIQPATGYFTAFSADSSHLFYGAAGGMTTTEFLVLDGRESEEIRSVSELAFAPAGGHIATAGGGQVTLDGNLLEYPNIDIAKTRASLLSFSPDGTHFAFRLGSSLYIDGKEQTGFVPTFTGPPSNVNTAAYIWSPDSKHVAYFCHAASSAMGDDTYLCIDDKAVHVGGNPTELNLLFSSDSRHLFWMRGAGQDKYRVYIDGKAVYDGARAITMGAECWQATPDGALLAVLQDGTSINRVRITPAPSFSLDTLLAKAVPNAR